LSLLILFLTCSSTPSISDSISSSSVAVVFTLGVFLSAIGLSSIISISKSSDSSVDFLEVLIALSSGVVPIVVV